MASKNVGGFRHSWNEAARTGWSNFTSGQYENVMATVRAAMAGSPLWEIERYWRGYQ